MLERDIDMCEYGVLIRKYLFNDWMISSNCPVFAALILKYVDSSIGQRTPFGT